MQHGLEGRRIAVASPDGARSDDIGVVEDALKRVGATVDALTNESGDDMWHGGLYAALVVVGGEGDDRLPASHPRLVQLVREFLVSEKPVAARGTGVAVVVEAGGAAGRTLAVDESLKAAAETSGGKVVGEPTHADGCLISAQARGSVEEFMTRVVKEFSAQLEEAGLDDMSAQSFPASDPPATNSASAGPTADPNA
jgi:putative intracellular protease/amidase